MITQKSKIIHYLNRYGHMTKRDAYKLGIMNPGARICELRESGIPIKTEMKPVTNADGSKSHVAFYSYDRTET